MNGESSQPFLSLEASFESIVKVPSTKYLRWGPSTRLGTLPGTPLHRRCSPRVRGGARPVSVSVDPPVVLSLALLRNPPACSLPLGHAQPEPL